ncbi:MAG: glycosyltransferase family 87 protein [Bryobacteraceae bacterium]
MPALVSIFSGALLPIAAAVALGERFPKVCGVLRFALGAALLGQALFIAMAIGSGWVPVAVCVVCLAGLLSWRPPRLEQPWLAAAPILGYYFVHALAPETQPDAIGYHLGLVSGWLRDGGFFSETGHFEVMPHGLELLFTPAVAVGGYSAAKLVHFAFLVATLPLIVSTGRALGISDCSPWAAGIIYLAAPVVGVDGTCAYNDAALAFFTMSAFRLSLDGDRAATGIAAGFCYAVKMTGGVVLLYLLARRQWRALAVSLAMTAPWVARAWWLTGNPAAPLFNGFFPNPFFHLSTEQGLVSWVRSYDIAGPLWREWTLGGTATQGLTGPAFLLLPVALVALRRPAGRIAALAAFIVALPVLANAGTRFLIPFLGFVPLLWALAVPGRGLWLVAAAQVIACAPGVINRWNEPNAWRLQGFPIRAALRLEPEPEYLRRTTNAYEIAQMIEGATQPGDRVLDLAGIAEAYTDRDIRMHWQWADADRAANALYLASQSSRRISYRGLARWPKRAFSSLRIVQEGDGPEPWGFQEIEPLRDGKPVFPSSQWTLTASVNPWDLPFAFDRNPASRWQTWEPRRDGMWIEIAFPAPVELDGIRVLAPMGENNARYRIEGGGGVEGRGDVERGYWNAISLRDAAGRYLRREGFTHVAVRIDGDGFGAVGRDLEWRAADWGLRRAARAHGVYLYSQSGRTTRSR